MDAGWCWTNPTVTRSRIALEIATELVSDPEQHYNQAMVLLRDEVAVKPEWRLNLFSSNSHEGITAVVAGQAAMAMVNPSAQLGLAYHGAAPYDRPLSLSQIHPPRNDCGGRRGVVPANSRGQRRQDEFGR